MFQAFNFKQLWKIQIFFQIRYTDLFALFAITVENNEYIILF